MCGVCLCVGARFDDGAGGDNEVQRTMLELINQLDGFDARGNIKVTTVHQLVLLLGFCSLIRLCLSLCSCVCTGVDGNEPTGYS